MSKATAVISFTEMRQFVALRHYARAGVAKAIEHAPYDGVEEIAMHAATFALQQAFESDGEIRRLTIENERLTKMVQELMATTPARIFVGLPERDTEDSGGVGEPGRCPPTQIKRR